MSHYAGFPGDSFGECQNKTLWCIIVKIHFELKNLLMQLFLSLSDFFYLFFIFNFDIATRAPHFQTMLFSSSGTLCSITFHTLSNVNRAAADDYFYY